MRFYRSKLYASVLPILGVALFVGFAGALLGIGGGFIMVPALLYVFRVPTAVVIGTSQFQILCTTLVSLVLHAVLNQAVDVVLASLLIVGGVFGAQFGARAGRNLRAELFRFMLALLLLAVGAALCPRTDGAARTNRSRSRSRRPRDERTPEWSRGRHVRRSRLLAALVSRIRPAPRPW